MNAERQVKHSQGPWRVERSDWNSDSCRDSAISVVNEDGDFIAQAWTDFEEETSDARPVDGVAPHGTGLANARLIASAPELLASLKALVGIIDAAGLINLSNGVQLGQMSWCAKASDRMEWAHAVIAKAEWKQ